MRVGWTDWILPSNKTVLSTSPISKLNSISLSQFIRFKWKLVISERFPSEGRSSGKIWTFLELCDILGVPSESRASVFSFSHRGHMTAGPLGVVSRSSLLPKTCTDVQPLQRNPDIISHYLFPSHVRDQSSLSPVLKYIFMLKHLNGFRDLNL